MSNHRRRRQWRASWRMRGPRIYSFRNPDYIDSTGRIIAGAEFSYYGSVWIHRRKGKR